MSKKEQFENLEKEQFDEYKKVCELIGLLHKSKFIIGYNEDGEATDVLPGIKSRIVDKGKGSIPTDLVCRLMEKGETEIDIKTTRTRIYFKWNSLKKVVSKGLRSDGLNPKSIINHIIFKKSGSASFSNQQWMSFQKY